MSALKDSGLIIGFVLLYAVGIAFNIIEGNTFSVFSFIVLTVFTIYVAIEAFSNRRKWYHFLWLLFYIAYLVLAIIGLIEDDDDFLIASTIVGASITGIALLTFFGVILRNE